MEYKINNVIPLKYDRNNPTSDHTPIYAIINYKQPIIPKPILSLLIGDYKNLQRCKLSKIKSKAKLRSSSLIFLSVGFPKPASINKAVGHPKNTEF